MNIPSLPSLTHHPPPTLPKRDSAQGESGLPAEWRIKAGHVSALPLSNIWAVLVTSPGTLPDSNLVAKKPKGTFCLQHGQKLSTAVQTSVPFWIRQLLGNKVYHWVINELGVSSLPEKGRGTGLGVILKLF